MSTTFAAIRRHMLTRTHGALGRAFAISGLAAQTVTCSSIATGTLTGNNYINKHLLRADAASVADRWRIDSAFDSSLGKFTHAGTAYADTTATGETLEVLEYDPFLFDEAINLTLGFTRRWDVTYIPAGNNGVTWLAQLPWLDQPSRVKRIELESCPILSRDRFFEKLNTYSATGVLTPPDDWVVVGGTSTALRSTTQTWKHPSSLAMTRTGSDMTLTQTVGLLEDGVTAQQGSNLRGQTVSVYARVWSAVASQVRLFMNDGVTTTRSSFHTGGSGWEELTIDSTVLSTAATTLTFGIEVNTSATVAYAGDCCMTLNAVTDAVRRDGPWGTQTVWGNRYRQEGGLPTVLPRVGLGRRYAIHSTRAYPALDDSLIRSGSADAAVIDAPVELIATGAVWRMMEGQAAVVGKDGKKQDAIAANWKRRYEQLAQAHLYVQGTQTRGIGVREAPWGRPAVGVR